MQTRSNWIFKTKTIGELSREGETNKIWLLMKNNNERKRNAWLCEDWINTTLLLPCKSLITPNKRATFYKVRRTFGISIFRCIQNIHPKFSQNEVTVIIDLSFAIFKKFKTFLSPLAWMCLCHGMLSVVSHRVSEDI